MHSYDGGPMPESSTLEACAALDRCFKAYDIRAVYPSPLSEEVAYRTGFGVAQFLAARVQETGVALAMPRHVAVGHDMRLSSPSLVSAVKRGIRAFGLNVVDVGLVDTPFTYFATNHLGTCGAVQVTASHNPSQYNGFKVSQPHARPVGMGSGLERVKAFAAAAPADAGELAGIESKRDLWKEYRDHLLRRLDSRVLEGSCTLRIAVDASNGMAGTAFPKVLDGIAGLKVERINFDNSTGTFVHEPNPLVEANLAQVREAVVRGGANFGVCFDGDADRCMIVDEQGTPIGCDLLLAAMVGDALRDNPGAAIVYDLRSSRAVREAIEAAGGVPIESRVGHVFMKARMAETAAPIGGELSGHFYFADMWGTDSGLRAFLAVCSLLARDPRPLSAILQPFRRYAQSGEINFKTDDTTKAIERLTAAYPSSTITRLDGVSLDAGDWWCNVRASNTEPLLRLNLESASAPLTAARVAEVGALLGHRVDH